MKFSPILIFSFIFLIWACTGKQEKAQETESARPETGEVSGGQEQMQQSWIDESEMNNLSSNWVDESDKGQLSTTWTEDAFAQELNTEPGLANSWVDESGETIYKKAEVPPEFIGGKEALFNYFKENINYPDDVEEGVVYVAFVVGSDGAIRDARVFKGVKESMDREALRLINGMPNWDPGMIEGKTVASVYGLPVIFRP
jgi:outer membrane biosynthesis protein TonB